MTGKNQGIPHMFALPEKTVSAHIEIWREGTPVLTNIRKERLPYIPPYIGRRGVSLYPYNS